MPFIPIDVNQCQVDKPNGCTFTTLGGSPKLVRCTETPRYIVIEKSMKNNEDNFQGAMSMCIDCKSIFVTQKTKELENYIIAEIVKVSA